MHSSILLDPAISPFSYTQGLTVCKQKKRFPSRISGIKNMSLHDEEISDLISDHIIGLLNTQLLSVKQCVN